MSDNGIYVSLSGALAQTQRLDTIANNIANVNTPGFKKDTQVFREYLTAAEKQPDVIAAPKVTASIESFYDSQGGEKGFVDSIGTHTDFSQAQLKATGNNFDLGIEGKGFFEVLTPQGVRFTRNGAFRVDQSGKLVTKEGFPVLREGLGEDPNGRTIQLNSSNVTVAYSGEIFQGNEAVSRLSMVKVQNPEILEKVGSSFYKIKNNANAELAMASDAQIHQGFLEQSNINIVKEMTDMITATRAFEANQQAMKAADQINGKLVNEVGKVN